MRDIEAQTLQLLIDFCYTSEITINEQNVQSILPAACLLQINEVQVNYFLFEKNVQKILIGKVF